MIDDVTKQSRRKAAGFYLKRFPGYINDWIEGRVDDATVDEDIAQLADLLESTYCAGVNVGSVHGRKRMAAEKTPAQTTAASSLEAYSRIDDKLDREDESWHVSIPKSRRCVSRTTS